jgi:hypothetical protein
MSLKNWNQQQKVLAYISLSVEILSNVQKKFQTGKKYLQDNPGTLF